MNTMRRKIKNTENNCGSFPTERTLYFEGDNGKFQIVLENFNQMGGCQRTNISLNKTEAERLCQSLQTFLK